MPSLPTQPDLDQLRRQAKELLRAAQAGDSAATTRIRAVSDELTLAAAQLPSRRSASARWNPMGGDARSGRRARLAKGVFCDGRE